MLESIPRATRAILFTNAVVYGLQLLLGPDFTARFVLWPLGPNFAPWQLVTYGFLHDTHSFAHILFNMFAVYMFGSQLERFFGVRRYLALYFASLLAAAATQLAVTYAMGSAAPTLGASGAVFGLLLAFAVYFPKVRLILLFPPIPMPAWLFVTLYGILELVLGITRTQDDVAHFAHLGGLLGGALVILFWRMQGTPPRRPF